MTARIVGASSHATVTALGEPLRDWEPLAELAAENDEVIGAAPYGEGQAMLVHAGRSTGALIRGVLPEVEVAVSELGEKLEGVASLEEALAPGEFGVLLGADLAAFLGAVRGDRIMLITPEASVTPLGFTPRVKRFLVTGAQRQVSQSLRRGPCGKGWMMTGLSLSPDGLFLRYRREICRERRNRSGRRSRLRAPRSRSKSRATSRWASSFTRGSGGGVRSDVARARGPDISRRAGPRFEPCPFRDGRPRRRALATRDHGAGTTTGDRVVASAGVVGAICRDAASLPVRGDLAGRVGQHRCVTDMASVHRLSRTSGIRR